MTILIVDDEYYVIERLVQILTPIAMEEDLRIVTAEDGTGGLEQALLTPPDLLITDIQMHRMNGLELAEQVQKLAADCRIIFLSNYSDKEYLHSAIQLRAVEYIEKPAEPERLTALVRREIHQLKRERSEHQALEAHLAQNRENSKKLLLQLVSQMLRRKNATLDSIRSQCDLYNMTFLFHCVYRCLLLRTAPDLTPDFTLPIADLLPPNVSMLPADTSEKGVLILFLYADAQGSLSDTCIHSIWQILSDYPAITGLAAGPIASDYQQVFLTWQQAQSAFNQLFFDASAQIIFYNTKSISLPQNLGAEISRRILSSLSSLRLTERKKELFTTPLQSQSLTTVSDIRSYFCMTADLLLQYSVENLLDFHETHTNFELYEEIWRAQNLMELESLTNHWVQALIRQGLGDERIVRMTTAYIHKHYSDPEFGLDDLCSFTGYSKSYLSTIFKQMTGTNISTYINKVRIDNASYLLKNTDKPLKDIVVESGFTNHSYFGKIFKTVTGQTPKKFRK